MTWKVDKYNQITEIEPGETIPRVVATVNRKEAMPLIAAAPEMYEALNNTLGAIIKLKRIEAQERNHYINVEDIVNILEKALKKARGE